MDEVLAAARALLSDIEGMRQEHPKRWYGGFGYFTVEGDEAYVEWPNLGISAERLGKALKTLDGRAS
jgi:hypothetical protein